MSENTAAQRRAFQHQIFLDLEQKLGETGWNGGAAEAHGLACGLACRGITSDTIRPKAKLFQLNDNDPVELLEGIIGLACRDLNDEDLGFTPMLPADDASLYQRAEGLSSWCQGFLQGVCHDNADILQSENQSVQEAVNDILRIGHIEPDPNNPEQSNKDLVELEEYLKVAVQLIYDELNPAPIDSAPQQTH